MCDGAGIFERRAAEVVLLILGAGALGLGTVVLDAVFGTAALAGLLVALIARDLVALEREDLLGVRAMICLLLFLLLQQHTGLSTSKPPIC